MRRLPVHALFPTESRILIILIRIPGSSMTFIRWGGGHFSAVISRYWGTIILLILIWRRNRHCCGRTFIQVFTLWCSWCLVGIRPFRHISLFKVLSQDTLMNIIHLLHTSLLLISFLLPANSVDYRSTIPNNSTTATGGLASVVLGPHGNLVHAPMTVGDYLPDYSKRLDARIFGKIDDGEGDLDLFVPSGDERLTIEGS